MVRTSRLTVVSISLLLAGLLIATLAPPAKGSVCNGFIEFDYISGPSMAALVGDTFRVRLTLFSDGITDGPNNVFEVNRVRFDLDCNGDMALGLPCTDDGDVMLFQGNITTNQCNDVNGNPVSFSANSSSGDFSPNEVIFTPSAQVVMPHDTVLASGCQIEFDVQVESYSNDSNPDRVEEVAGYLIDNNDPDAECDNGLMVAASQSSAITLLAPTPTPTPSQTNTPTPTPTFTPATSSDPTPTPTITPIPTPTSAGPGCATLRKTHSDLNAGDLHPGTLVRFRIVYNNICREPLTYLIDALPPELSFVSATGGGVYSNGSVTWSGTALSRRSRSVYFTALINQDVLPNAVIENIVTLFDDMGRTVTATDFLTTLPPGNKPPPPISLRASAPATSNPGRIFSVIFTYKNMDNGGTLVLTLDPNETLLSATPPPATSNGAVLTWSGGALVLPNGSIKLRVQAASNAPLSTVLQNAGILSMVGGQVQSVTANTLLQ